VAYSPHQQRRTSVTRETNVAEFTRADGCTDSHGRYTEQTSSSPDVDAERFVVDQKCELTCGCYWPDAEIAGVCAECVQEEVAPNVCKAHYVVCRCGTPCCWKHSHLTEDGQARLCTRCHIREQNKALKSALVSTVARVTRWIFVKQEGLDQKPECHRE